MRMKNAQFTIDEFMSMMRRRKFAFVLPAVLIIAVCGVGAFLLPKQYESSTTILMQENQTLNPLLDYRLALQLEPEDKLGDFDEIVYSRPTIEALMDSLGMQSLMKNLAVKDRAILQISKNIKTAKQGTNSFTISYYDTIPARAQKAVTVLSELFIQTKMNVENRKNEFTVSFFRQKVAELRDKFDKSQQELVETLQRHINQLPEDDRTLYANISRYGDEIQSVEQSMKNYSDAMNILDAAARTSADQHIDLTKLYLIPLLDVPYSSDLQKTVTAYDQLSQEYTEEYPDVRSARAKVIQLVGLVENAIRSEESRKQDQIMSLENRRHDAILAVQKATAATSQDQDLQSNFDIYQKLYGEMEVKLEQAETTRDLGENSAGDYIVINPPELPVKPAKPNKALIIGGGFGLALFMGLLSAGITELFDTRIRIPQDVEIFEKPIIAYLPAPKSERG
jgi:protein tyrosine kinase modulator